MQYLVLVYVEYSNFAIMCTITTRDIITYNCGTTPMLIINCYLGFCNSPPEHHWLFMDLSDFKSKSNSIGSVLFYIHQGRSLVRNKICEISLFLTIFLGGRHGLVYFTNSKSWPLCSQIISSNGIDIVLWNISTSTPERLMRNISELALTSGCHLGLTEHRS